MVPEIEEVFGKITPTHIQKQRDYWQSVTPATTEDLFRRWLFAFCSVHTTWKSNVAGYLALRDLGWLKSKRELRRRLEESRVGLHNARADYIWQFRERFWESGFAVAFYAPLPGETWPQARNRIAKATAGLGYAKTSFALELCYPNTAGLVCLDVHMLRLYGYAKMNGRSGTTFHTLYEQLEQDWLARCRALHCAPYIARCCFWDRMQKKRSSRYWSRCLEL